MPVVAELSIRVTGGPDAPSEARSALRRFHPELPPELMQVVVLLASELVSNAVQHTRAGSIPIRFEVMRSMILPSSMAKASMCGRIKAVGSFLRGRGMGVAIRQNQACRNRGGLR